MKNIHILGKESMGERLQEQAAQDVCIVRLRPNRMHNRRVLQRACSQGAALLYCHDIEALRYGVKMARRYPVALIADCRLLQPERVGCREKKLLMCADAYAAQSDEQKNRLVSAVGLDPVRFFSYSSSEAMYRYAMRMAKRRMRNKRDGALICGAYGRGNAGDDAILNAIVHELHQADPELPVCVLSRQPNDTRQKSGVQSVQTFHMRELWQVLGHSSLFISGGGSLIQNATSSRSLYYYLATMWLAKRHGCKVMMYGCGIGPVYGSIHRRIAAHIINRNVDIITLRDEDSLRELKQMGVDHPRIVRTADPTICIQPLASHQTVQLMQRLEITGDASYIGFSVREWKGFDRAAPEIARAANQVWEIYHMIPVFISMEHPNDVLAAKKVMQYLSCPHILIEEQLTISETLSLLSRMSVVVGMRLHSLIFAAENGVPCVGISYDVKVDGFLRSIGQEEATLHMSDVTTEQIMQQIDCAMTQQAHEQWKETAQRLTAEESENLKQLCLLLEEMGNITSHTTDEPENDQNPRKRIAIFQSDLHVGGIQKSLVNFMSQPLLDRYDVDVYLFQKEVFFDLSAIRPHVHIHYLKPFPYYFRFIPFGAIMRLMPRFHFPKDVIYDVAIDFSNYQQDCAFGALTIPAKKRVMWIHNDMEIKYQEEPKYRILWRFFHSKFAWFSEFVAVSDGIIQPFKNKTGLTDATVTAIPNLIDTTEIFTKCGAHIDFSVDPQKYNIASMGRLCHQKGYDILIDTLGRVCKTRNDIACYILGDGPDRAALEQQAKQCGLGDVVHFLGNQPNPFPYLAQMDAFYLESRYEGQGMVLWEAKALGLKLIFPKRLEKYNINLVGTDNIEQALLTGKREHKTMDDLHEYNEEICRRLTRLLETP